MKKAISIILSVILAFSLFGCAKAVSGDEELIKIARQEIPVSDAETIDMEIVGRVDKETASLVWFKTGNEYQAHGYYPIEFNKTNENKLNFSHLYTSYDRDEDIGVSLWNNGYCFLVNNEDCKTILIEFPNGTKTEISVDTLPFVYYYENAPKNFEYKFLDINGNELK